MWKDDTYVDQRFELGERAIKRNSSADWDLVRQRAIEGELSSIPSEIFIRYYSSLRAIAADFAEPVAITREVFVFVGRTGVGKSRRAWDEAGNLAYAKDPRSKFWYGYKGQENVIVDEFRGGIDVAHLLRWLDRYPVSVETKGSSRPLMAKKVWITSNLPPSKWYPEIDYETQEALERRLKVEIME